MHTLPEKAAQVVFPRLGSNMVPPIRVEEDLSRFKSMLQEFAFGGLVLFNGHAQHTPHALAELQSLVKQPLIVGSDIERGAGQQLEGATLFPHARAIGRAGIKATKAFATITAREALACGVHIAFTPVADVNLDPKNPIIGIRAFGTTTPEVKEHVKAFVSSCQETGLYATAKHFPGHGNTSTDSHEALPVVTSSLEELSRHDLAPFKAAIDEGVTAVMTAHVAFPALDPAGLPATLSHPILTSLLRSKLGFKGPVITDSLIMKGIWTQGLSIEDSVARLINAGVDILLDPPDPIQFVEAIIKAVESGKVEEAQLDASIERIQQLRIGLTQRFGNHVFIQPYAADTQQCIGSQEHLETAQQIAYNAIDTMAPPTVNMESLDSTLALLVLPFKTHLDPEEQPLGRLLRAQNPNLIYVEIDDKTPHDMLEQIRQQREKVDKMLLFVVSKPAAWRAFGLPDHLKEYLQQLITPSQTTIIAMGDPGILNDLPPSTEILCTYSDTPTSQQGIARWLKEG